MAVCTKKSTRAKPVLAVAGVKYRSGRFLRVGRAFFAPGSGDLGRTATANLILITRQPRRSPIAAGGIGVTFLPLECRSGSLRADSYLCAAPEARDGLQTERKTEERERERIEEGNCSTCAHPLTVQYMLSPPVRILEILQRVNTGVRMQAPLYSSPPADFSSSFWREEDLGLSCPKVPDESSMSFSGSFRVKIEWIFMSDRVNERCECWSPRKVSRMGDIRLPIDLTLPTVSVIARLTNLFTVSQEKNHQQGLMGGRFECLLVNNVPGVLDEIDVGGSADSTGVWIWTLLPRQKRPREHPRSAMGKRAPLLALGKAFQNKEPRCWFNGGQYVNQWLAVVTMSRPRRPASGYLFKPSPPLLLPA
ncbi:hypothetical protein ALC57_17054 [Trachymyrmex cornetzi]|uniref:Uncharacterized protein n=1 Tax=Trachymyrmex cornetzi TaxID=471704 RepID=A0A195DEK2_9HYME|nr:hypothetical protein ALC57_17054 [Trachymyrmex cornetzi]